MAKRTQEESAPDEPDDIEEELDDDPDTAVDPEEEARAARQRETQGRLSTMFGWVAGAALGLLINFALFRMIGGDYPTTITTFAFVIVGAFGGMTLSDRLGAKGFKPLGIAAGVLLALILAVVAAFFLSPPTS